jgi:hypothetical protein
MNEKLRKLRLISRKIDAELFFEIRISDYSITFQGDYKSGIVKYLKKHKWNIETCSDGLTRATRSDIRIVLS